MSDINEKLAKLRELYPEEIAAIDAEQQRVSELLKQKGYSLLECTQALLALCRTDIQSARLMLATVRDLSEDARAELWHIIDAREWFLKLVSKDYDAELAQIEGELEADLAV